MEEYYIAIKKNGQGANNVGDCCFKGYLASRWIMKNKQRLNEKLSQTKGIYGDMKTKCNVGAPLPLHL